MKTLKKIQKIVIVTFGVVIVGSFFYKAATIHPIASVEAIEGTGDKGTQ